MLDGGEEVGFPCRAQFASALQPTTRKSGPEAQALFEHGRGTQPPRPRARENESLRPRRSVDYGSSVSPIRNLSTPRAASRPSAIAHTISDCPRDMSPAANPFGTA